MRLCCDRNGFPLVYLDEMGLALSVLPFSKAQFERLWAEKKNDCTWATDDWYETALSLNPRTRTRLASSSRGDRARAKTP